MKLRELLEQPHGELSPQERETLRLLLGAQPLRKALHRVIQVRRDMAEQALNVRSVEELFKIQGRAEGLLMALDLVYESAAEIGRAHV